MLGLLDSKVHRDVFLSARARLIEPSCDSRDVVLGTLQLSKGTIQTSGTTDGGSPSSSGSC